MNLAVNRRKVLNYLIVGTVLVTAIASAYGDIDSSTWYVLDLTNVREGPKKVKWADPAHIAATPEGLGWGNLGDEGTRDFWLETEPIAIGLSWRPTAVASIKATFEQPGTSGMLYIRYSADGKHWTAWQHLEGRNPAAGKGPTQVFQGTVRVPYRERSRYDELRLQYARREDVPWGSDEEALVKEVLQREPKFFETSTPFIGYVQFLYEAQLPGGHRLKRLQCEVSWHLSGIHVPPVPPRDENARKDRDVPWRFKAP